MKVLISGAGIAGLTTAYWLKQYGFTPVIIERAPALLTGGYKIDVRGTALEILRKMKIYDAVLAASTDMQGALLVDRTGKIINEMTGNEFGHRVGDDLEIIRGTLCQILMDKVSDVEFIFGDTIKSIKELPDKVQVEFFKHDTRDFDLVIGADGLHSNVRRLVFGEEEKYLHDLGLYLCVFTVPNYLNLDRLEMQYTEIGRVAAIWSARGEDNSKVCFGFAASSADVNLNDRKQQQELIKKVFSDLAWEVPHFLQLMNDATDYYFDSAAQVNMPLWSKGRVVLLGDAAFCASPMSGQGSSLALVGAYVLAGEIFSAQGDITLAFNNYEESMRPFIERNQALGITAANLMKSNEKNKLVAWLFNQVGRCAPGWLIQFFIKLSTKRINKAANSITLKDY